MNELNLARVGSTDPLRVAIGASVGHEVERDFDLAKEQRRGRLWWPFLGGLILSLLSFPFVEKILAIQIFQGWVVTSLFFGENLYVQRRSDLNKLWLWKALCAILPLHALFLSCLFWFDRVSPGIMTKAIVFLPMIAVGLVVESLFAQRIIEAFDVQSR